jgi:hypothetical protein
MPTPHPRPWHRGSLFGDGPRRPLDREQRARFRSLVSAHRRARRLTANAVDVAEALVRRLGSDGQLDPAHATLANDAGCGERTVRRTLAVLRALGLVRWTCRLVRAGWRAEQTSNAYELVPTAAAPALHCGGQIGRESPRDRKREANTDADARQSAAQQLLALGFTVPVGWSA